MAVGFTCFRVVIKHQANLKSLEPALYNYVIMLMLPASFNLETPLEGKKNSPFSRRAIKTPPIYPTSLYLIVHTIINNQFWKR